LIDLAVPARALAASGIETAEILLDVSKWQGNIDYDAAVRAGVKAVICKMSEGGTHTDERWERNYKGFTERGVWVGGYHFVRFHESAKANANNMLRALNGKTLGMPVSFDVELFNNQNKAHCTGVLYDMTMSLLEVGSKYFDYKPETKLWYQYFWEQFYKPVPEFWDHKGYPYPFVYTHGTVDVKRY